MIRDFKLQKCIFYFIFLKGLINLILIDQIDDNWMDYLTKLVILTNLRLNRTSEIEIEFSFYNLFAI